MAGVHMSDFKIESNIPKPSSGNDEKVTVPGVGLATDYCEPENIDSADTSDNTINSGNKAGLVGSSPTSRTIVKRGPGRPKVDHGFPCAGPCEHYLDCWIEKGLPLPDWIHVSPTNPVITQDPLDIDPE